MGDGHPMGRRNSRSPRRDGSRPDGPRCDGPRRDRRSPDDLLVAAGLGDTDALAALFDATSRAVYGLLHGAASDTDRAQEATRRVYLSLWRTAPQFDPRHETAHTRLLRETHREFAALICGPSGRARRRDEQEWTGR